jgi:hypothetical protein
MPSAEILNSYSLPELKKIIRATNITGYSKLKKDELIKLMLRPEHKSKFEGLMKKEKRTGVGTEKDMKKRMALVREFKKKAKRPREIAEFKEAQEKIEKQLKKKFPKKEEPKKERISDRPILSKEELKKRQEERAKERRAKLETARKNIKGKVKGK